MDDIELLPSLPLKLKEAAEKNELAIFIGAGISRYLGCKGWNELANNLLKKCNEKGLISFFEQEALSKHNDPKKIITICNKILDDELFMDEMKKSLNDKEVKKNNPALEIYRNLFKLNGLFITTNADKHIDQLFESENIIIENFKANNINNNYLYKIHGSITKKDSLIFTAQQYINRYNKSNFVEFLKNIFNKYTVLFVGYGLSEFELLDYLVKTTYNTIKRHYYVNGYFKHEKRIFELDKLYFDELGIELIAYQKDEKGYEQLKDVIKHWAEQIEKETIVPINTFEEIDKVLENPYDE